LPPLPPSVFNQVTLMFMTLRVHAIRRFLSFRNVSINIFLISFNGLFNNSSDIIVVYLLKGFVVDTRFH